MGITVPSWDTISIVGGTGTVLWSLDDNRAQSLSATGGGPGSAVRILKTLWDQARVVTLWSRELRAGADTGRTAATRTG
jgi:hypothetical protein